MYEFIDSIDKCLGGCGDNIGVGRESIVTVAVVFNCHMHLSDIIRALVDCLYKELLNKHLAMDNLLDGSNGCVDRAVA